MGLYYPEQLRILAIDPGLNNTGVSYITFDNVTKSIIHIDAYTIITEPMVRHHPMSSYVEDRVVKHFILKETFIKIIIERPVDLVISEAPFFYNSKPNAFRALVEVIMLYRLTLAELFPTIPFIQLEPLMVKRYVKSLNIHSKDSTKEALKLLGMGQYIDLNALDEHATDAISVGYAFLKSRDFLIGVVKCKH